MMRQACAFGELQPDARNRALDDYLFYQHDDLGYDEAESRLAALCDSEGWKFDSNGRIQL